MKKGFTLIELLAVILILGIIALIAIPTVSNILKEAKGGAFNATVEQVVKSVENNCQLEKVDNEEVTNVYTINNGKIKPKIDIKGSLPDNGIIYVNDNCAVTLGIDDNKHNASKDLNNDNIVYNDCTSNSCASKEHLLYTEVLSKIENAVNTWKEEFPGEMPPNGKTYKITLAYFKKRGFIDFDFRNPINNLCIADDKDVEITNNNGKMEVYFNTSVPACQVVFLKTLVYQAFCCSLSCDSFDIIPQQNGDVNTKFSIFLNFFHGNFCQQYIVFSLHGAYNFWTVCCIFLRLKQKLCLNVAGE